MCNYIYVHVHAIIITICPNVVNIKHNAHLVKCHYNVTIAMTIDTFIVTIGNE